MPKNVLRKLKTVLKKGMPEKTPSSGAPAENTANWNDNYHYREASSRRSENSVPKGKAPRNGCGEFGFLFGGLSVLFTIMQYIGMGFFVTRSVQYDVSGMNSTILGNVVSAVGRADLIPLGIFVVIASSCAALTTVLGLVLGIIGSRRREKRFLTLFGVVCSCVSAAAFLTGIVILFVFRTIHS